jgi:predicted dehydrogenase
MLNVGIIGCGSIARQRHAAEYKHNPNTVITGVFDVSRERAEAMAKDFGGKVYDTAEALIADASIDAVSVCVANAFHAPITIDALNHGKHVLCEKPLAINAPQAERMIRFAHEKGLILLEAIRPVHDPFLAALRENLHKVGRIRRATFEFCQYSSRYDRFLAGERPNVFEASLGNAALMDLAVYCLHACVGVFGMPQKLSAGASFLPNGTEAAGTMLLDYGSQQTTISYSKVTSSLTSASTV